MVQVWHGPPIIILHYENKMRCDNWSLMYFSSLSHDTISTASFKGEKHSQAEHTRSLFNASSLWGYRNDTMRSTLKWSKIIPYFCPHKWFIKGKNRGKREKEKGRRRIEKDKHIPSTYSLHYGGGGRSFNYWLPSQANIPACQGPFWLSFGQSPSDGPHFLLNRTRRCCENGDTWSCVQETGNASARPKACQDTLHTFSSMNPTWVGSQRGGV